VYQPGLFFTPRSSREPAVQLVAEPGDFGISFEEPGASDRDNLSHHLSH
jgi:hypothetical protein